MADIPTWIPLAIVAPFVGSFLGVVVYRLPQARAVVVGRSSCDLCGHDLGVVDLFPILSWLFRRGRCGYCRGPIDPTYPVDLPHVGGPH